MDEAGSALKAVLYLPFDKGGAYGKSLHCFMRENGDQNADGSAANSVLYSQSQSRNERVYREHHRLEKRLPGMHLSTSVQFVDLRCVCE